MTKLTVWGDAGGPNGQSATYNRFGQLTEACSYRELDLELPADGVEVDCDHEKRNSFTVADVTMWFQPPTSAFVLIV